MSGFPVHSPRPTALHIAIYIPFNMLYIVHAVSSLNPCECQCYGWKLLGGALRMSTITLMRPFTDNVSGQ